ncbi:MAG: PDZ domain-containing protein [Deltaproteobacteria bacterium]|nr:PDZ domain-containing protein [Deltaproteobacteria bacterium]
MRTKRILVLILYGILAMAPMSLLPYRAGATEAFGGVGVLLDFDPQDPNSVLIFSVTYKSPADKAKIRRGERLLKIDAVDVTGLTLQQLSEKIRGPLGSQVTLTLQGAGGAVRDVPLVRDAIKGGPVIAMPPPNMASTGVFFTAEEKEILKKKIVGLTTDEQREKMLNLLKALKAKQITKTQFMGFLKSDF